MINKNALWNPEDLGIPYKEESDTAYAVGFAVISLALIALMILTHREIMLMLTELTKI
jgi:hypothetical protein